MNKSVNDNTDLDRELDQYFIYKCKKGLEKRGLATRPEYRKRLLFELDTIIRMKFSGYFLIVQDFVNWAKRNNIFVGPGRGSGTGSLCCYCLYITNLDPIQWNLLFERFLNPDRISMPDLDLDFEKRYRHLVIDYVRQKYGEDKVAHIGTFGKMKAKSAVRTVAKTLGHPYQIGDELTRLLLPPIAGKPQSLEKSINKVPKLNAYFKHPEGTQGQVLKWANKVENLVHSKGVHASGLAISNDSLLENVPLFRAKDGELTTQWEMNNIEEVGYIKFDFLGLDALDKIHICVDLVKEHYDIDINPDKIPLDDPNTFAMLRTGDSFGIFQLEASAGIKDLMVQIRPTSIEDLITLIAAYRPGPLGSDYLPIYLAIRAGTQDPEYLVPELEPILSSTDGFLLLQEQIIEICKQLCGYTGGEADEMRKVVGKKLPKLMAKHEPKFKDGWKTHGLPEKAADQLWSDIVGFSAYAFNLSHAAAYAYITYQTAYLKCHYRTEYLCAVMRCVGKKDKDHLIRCLTDCKKSGINVLPPDINTSGEQFSVTGDKEIRFGLGPIKNIGAGAIVILAERDEEGPFESLRDFCERVNTGIVNRKKLESLIKAGAFDTFGQSRATMLSAVEAVWQYRDEMKKCNSKMKTYEKKEIVRSERLKEIEEIENRGEKTKKKPLKAWNKPEEPQWPEIIEFDELPNRDIQAMEHELLGFFVSSHPLDNWNPKLLSDSFNTIEDIQKMGNGTIVSLAGVVTQVKEITTRNMTKMAFALLEDHTGSIEATIFSKAYIRVREILQEPKPLRINGVVDVIEADEGDRTTKIRVKNITILDLQEQSRTRPIKVKVHVEQAGALQALLEKYTGNLHEVIMSFTLHDGTIIRVPKHKCIGNHKGIFMRELARLNNEQGL